jgi:pantoate--beta-alanine ligase
VIVVDTFADARARGRGTVAVVPTMGFLHEGHLSLLEAARHESDTVTMTLYVNPLQFEEEQDLARYPADLDRDLALAEAAGVDIVFAPTQESMFGERPATIVDLPALTSVMEGAFRPGHFAGVATVVAKLFAGLQPDLAYFGRKDAQQLTVVRTLAADLSFPVRVVGRPIVREADGLALSSRNIFLDDEARRRALALSDALAVVVESVASGERSAAAIEDVARGRLDAAEGLNVEYAQLASQDDASLIEILDRPAFLAVAARVGPVRLIDNVHFDVDGDLVVADTGVHLQEPSLLYESRP